MIDFFIFFLKCVLLLSHLFNNNFSNCFDNSKFPLLFYGYSRDNRSLLDSLYSVKIIKNNNLVCDHHLNVLVHKAELFHTKKGLDGLKVLNCTELIRGKCLDLTICSIRINDCNSLLEDKRVNVEFLNVEYTCEQSKDPKPIFDGLNFREGCFGEYLIIPSSSCQEPIYPSPSSFQGKKLKSCLNSKVCRYVTVNDNILHTDDFFSKRDKITGHSYIKYDSFNLTGYAVLLNYTAVCEKPIYIKSTSFYDVAKEANSSKYTCFSIAYSPNPNNLFNLSSIQQSWLCRGTPVIVPMLGHLVALPSRI